VPAIGVETDERIGKAGVVIEVDAPGPYVRWKLQMADRAAADLLAKVMNDAFE
jgi:hypothetical protein